MTIRKVSIHMTESVYSRLQDFAEERGATVGALLEAWAIELIEVPSRKNELTLISERRAAAVRWARKIDAHRREREHHAKQSDVPPEVSD